MAHLVYEGFMRDLGLSLPQTVAYSLIYGFSQDKESCYFGSPDYLRSWLKCSERTAKQTLSDLEAMGLIEKTKVFDKSRGEKGSWVVTFRASVIPVSEMNRRIEAWKESAKVALSSEEGAKSALTYEAESGLQGREKRVQNLHGDNIFNNNNIYTLDAEPAPVDDEKPSKKEKTIVEAIISYGTHGNVKLTGTEAERLQQELGAQKFAGVVDWLDAYIEDKGYKHKGKTHNLAIRRWVITAYDETCQKRARLQGFSSLPETPSAPSLTL